MFDILTAVSDIMVAFFDLFIYIKLTALKRDTRAHRTFIYLFSAVLLAVYIVVTHVFGYPTGISSLLCISAPSLIMLFVLSKYKDARFFTTFCFVNTVSLIISFSARILGMYFGEIGAFAGCILLLTLFSVIYFAARPYFLKYRQLLDSVRDGWVSVMVSTLLIYALLIFFIIYPASIGQRREYILPYFLLIITVMSFYYVFIASLFQRKRLHDLNEQLSQEIKWHNMAYIDALTGTKNRMAYIERINELSRKTDGSKTIFAIMLDIDNFKETNDTLGHHAGDDELMKSAALLNYVFDDDCYEVFRTGGDEFAVIAIDVTRQELDLQLSRLGTIKGDLACEFSFGYAQVDPSEDNALMNAFVHADANMYSQKRMKKRERPVPAR